MLPTVLSWVITGLWIVTVTNALNLVDGLDGLATGVGAIIAATLALIAFQAGESLGICLGVALVGSLLGFLPFNFAPAKIFLGDTGALYLGFSISLLAMEGYLGGYRRASFLPFVVPLMALVTLFDQDRTNTFLEEFNRSGTGGRLIREQMAVANHSGGTQAQPNSYARTCPGDHCGSLPATCQDRSWPTSVRNSKKAAKQNGTPSLRTTR
jgi:hypothetical protein